MKSRSLLVLTHELPPLGGGAGRAIAQLCAALGALGFDIEVWTQAPAAGPRMDFPFRVKYFATGRKAQFQTNIPSILLYSLRTFLRGIFHRRFRPDAIFSNTAIPTGCVGACLGRFLGVPNIIWYHGADVHENRSAGARALYRLMLKAAWRHTALHCFVGAGLMRMAESYGGLTAPRMVLPLFADHVVPIAAPASVPAYIVDTAPTQGVKRARRVFLFAGRLEPVKKPFLFLDAIAWLAEQKRLPSDAGFRILGGGSLYHPLRKKIASLGLNAWVSLEPAVSGQAMAQVYAEAYALVLTSEVEGFPLTILEAGLCGVPSIGSDTLGINEEIEDGLTGLLFPKDDAVACARAMLRVLEEEGLRDQLGGHAQAAAAGLSSRKSAELFAAAWKEHIGP